MRFPRSPRSSLLAVVVAVGLSGAGNAQQTRHALASPSSQPLVFDGVTVIDVQHGARIPAQRVVIMGNHIQTVGNVSAVPLPSGARVVDAQGKYLIPGLWDMHTHSRRYTDFFYPLFIANGVTGIRDAGSEVPLDTMLLWRREILAGTRVGPPRQLLAGPAIDERKRCTKDERYRQIHTCITTSDSADARHLVDSLKTAGADFIKTYDLTREMYFVIAAEARHVGIPFGGHLDAGKTTAIEASDSGASILDHINTAGDMYRICLGKRASVEQCQPVAEQFRHAGTWFVPTLIRFATESGDHTTRAELDSEQLYNIGLHTGPATEAILKHFYQFASAFWGGRVFHPGWLRDSARVGQTLSRVYSGSFTDSSGFLSLMRRVGLPILAGTDAGAPVMEPQPPGFALHTELAMYVAEGLTPLEALQTATLNPALYLHGIDSLGIVAPGRLADLVLLDADPLADIANTTTIRAVIANGHYFDRAALDQLMADAQAKAKTEPQPLGEGRK